MKKITFYKFKESINPKVVGKISGDLNRQINKFIDPENTDEEALGIYNDFKAEVLKHFVP